jgi:hypothetical protein
MQANPIFPSYVIRMQHAFRRTPLQRARCAREAQDTTCLSPGDERAQAAVEGEAGQGGADGVPFVGLALQLCRQRGELSTGG